MYPLPAPRPDETNFIIRFTKPVFQQPLLDPLDQIFPPAPRRNPRDQTSITDEQAAQLILATTLTTSPTISQPEGPFVVPILNIPLVTLVDQLLLVAENQLRLEALDILVTPPVFSVPPRPPTPPRHPTDVLLDLLIESIHLPTPPALNPFTLAPAATPTPQQSAHDAITVAVLAVPVGRILGFVSRFIGLGGREAAVIAAEPAIILGGKEVAEETIVPPAIHIIGDSAETSFFIKPGSKIKTPLPRGLTEQEMQAILNEPFNIADLPYKPFGVPTYPAVTTPTIIVPPPTLLTSPITIFTIPIVIELGGPIIAYMEPPEGSISPAIPYEMPPSLDRPPEDVGHFVPIPPPATGNKIGYSSIILDNVTTVGTITVTNRVGACVVTLDNVTPIATATVVALGISSKTLDSITPSATGTIATPSATGTSTKTLSDLTMTQVGFVSLI